MFVCVLKKFDAYSCKYFIKKDQVWHLLDNLMRKNRIKNKLN